MSSVLAWIIIAPPIFVSVVLCASATIGLFHELYRSCRSQTDIEPTEQDSLI